MRTWLLLICGFAIATISSVGYQSAQRRRPSMFLIPAGYVGWVRVDYSVKEAKPLPIENGYYILELPNNGYLQTSTQNKAGWSSDEFYYYSSKGRQRLRYTSPKKGGMVWKRSVGQFYSSSKDGKRSSPVIYQKFFIGPENLAASSNFDRKGPTYSPTAGPHR